MDTKRTNTKGMATTNRDNDLFLKKHVGLIHCENKLTLIQRKICNILLFNALDKIDKQDIHNISLRQLCSLVGYNSNDIKLIKESIKSLISVVMEWNLLEDNTFLNENEDSEDIITWNASSLLAGASIRKGLISYSYSPQMKPVLASLEIYGRINLFVQAKFNSTYSLVLYENCVRFKNIKQTSWFPLELFRSLMGVSKDKYSSFKEFNRNVINVAVKEVNQKADILIEPKFQKVGRSIVAVQFLLSDNKSYLPTFKKSEKPKALVSLPQQASIVEILSSEFKLSQKQANEIALRYAHEYILEKINLVKAKKNIEHKGAYLLSALNKDYKQNENIVKIEPQKFQESSYLRESKQASEIVFLRNKYMTYKIKVYTEYLQQQVDSFRQKVYDQFEVYLGPNISNLRSYKKSGIYSPFVMADFIKFIEGNFPDLFKLPMNFDDYISSEEG